MGTKRFQKNYLNNITFVTIIALILLGSLFMSNCTNERQGYSEKVFKDFSRNSYFVSVVIKNQKVTKRVIVENSELYYFLNKTKALNEFEYVEYIRSKISNDGEVIIDSKDIDSLNYSDIKYNQGIDSNALRGKEHFIKYYFDSNMLKMNLTKDEQIYLIYRLLKFNILVKKDCETGYLIIEE